MGKGAAIENRLDAYVVLPSSSGSAATQCAPSLRRPVVLFVGVVIPTSSGSATAQCAPPLRRPVVLFLGGAPFLPLLARVFISARSVARRRKRPHRCPGPFAGATPAGTPTAMSRPICGCIARWKNAHTDGPAHLRVHRPLEELPHRCPGPFAGASPAGTRCLFLHPFVDVI